MKSAREIREQYQMANTLAVKSQKKNDKQVLPVCPASQNDLVDDRLVSYQQNLGVLEIPVNLIVGVAEICLGCIFLLGFDFLVKDIGSTLIGDD